MRDKKAGHFFLFLYFHKKIHDLCLNRDIQCTCDLITDQKFRLDHQCPGNGRTLTFSAAEFEGMSVIIFFFQSDQFQVFQCPLFPFFLRKLCIIPQSFLQPFSNGHGRIKGKTRILKYHLSFLAVFLLKLPAAFRQKVDPSAWSLHVDGSTVCFFQSCDKIRQSAFSAAALSDQPEALSRIQFKTDVTDCVYALSLFLKGLVQVFHLYPSLSVHHVPPPRIQCVGETATGFPSVISSV